MASYPAETAAGMVKKAFPWLAIPAALAAMPTITMLMNRLSGHDPAKAKEPAPTPEGTSPAARKQLYARILATHALQPRQPALMQTAKGLHRYRAGL